MTKKNKKSSDSDDEGSFTSRVVAIPKDEGDEPRSGKQKTRTDRIGDVLHDARTKRGDDLYLIAEYLCIKPAFLIALENSRYDEFPADAYVIGFLRTYANFLGIDGKEAVDRYRYEMAGRRKKPILSMPIPVPEGRIPSFIIIVAATVALIIIYSIWYSFSSTDRAEVHQPPTLPTSIQTTSADGGAAAGLTAPVAPSSAPAPVIETPAAPAAPAAAAPEKKQEATEAPASLIPPASPGIIVTAEKQTPSPKAQTAEKTAAPAPAKTEPLKEEKKPQAEEKKPEIVAKPAEVKPVTEVAPAPEAQPVVEEKKPPVNGEAGSRVVIRATQDSWIMVVDDSGKTLFDKVMRNGETYNVPNKSGLSLTTGNGSGIILSLDGNDLSKIANGPPRMIRDIELDPNRLKANYGTRR